MLSAAESWNSTVIAEMLSASSNSVVLSILWARRYKISNNLISTSKFHKLPELAAPVMWAHRDQVNGPPMRKEDSCMLRSAPKVLNLITEWLPKLPRKYAQKAITGMFLSGYHWVPLRHRISGQGSFSEIVCLEDNLFYHHLLTFIPYKKSEHFLKRL